MKELVKRTQSFLKTAKSGFESLFGYQQNIIESFQYLNAVKHGSIKELEAAVIKAESTGKSTATELTKLIV